MSKKNFTRVRDWLLKTHILKIFASFVIIFLLIGLGTTSFYKIMPDDSLSQTIVNSNAMNENNSSSGNNISNSGYDDQELVNTITLMTKRALEHVNLVIIVTGSFFSALAIAFGIYQWQSSTQHRRNLDEIYKNQIEEAVTQAKEDVEQDLEEKIHELDKQNTSFKQNMEIQSLILRGEVLKEDVSSVKEAVEVYHQLIGKVIEYDKQLDFNIHKFYLEIARIHYRQGNIDESLENYLEAIKDDSLSKDPHILASIASIYENRRSKYYSVAQAKMFIDKAILGTEKDYSSWFLKYRIYSQLINRTKLKSQYLEDLHESIVMGYNSNSHGLINDIEYLISRNPEKTYFKSQEELISYMEEEEIANREDIEKFTKGFFS